MGGLSVLKEIHAALPHHTLHYIGDSAHCPYGSKSPEEILHRTTILTEHLIRSGASLIVIACNSATIHAVEALRSRYPIPFVGMEPAIKPASERTKSGTIGVLATEASIAGEKFHHLLATHAAPRKIKVITSPCPDFVTLVEHGELDGDSVESAIARYAGPMLEAGADTLVLGCTHYPFLRPAIERFVGPEIALIDTGAAVARRTADLAPAALANHKRELHLQTSGDCSTLRNLLPKLCPDLQFDSITSLDISY